MDKQIHPPASNPGYETTDAHAGGVYKFLVGMALMLIASGLVCWGLFRVYSAHFVDQPATDSPFADTRQLPLGPQLQVNPREDWMKFRAGQEESLEKYAWENRGAGIVRVPIEEAMQMLVKKGVPVQGASQAQAPAAADATTQPAEVSKKP
jgi:hypothetical protein